MAAAAALVPALSPLNLRNPVERRRYFDLRPIPLLLRPSLTLSARRSRPCSRGVAYLKGSRLSRCFSAISASPASASTSYEFSDGTSEVEVRLELLGSDTYRDISVDTDDSSLRIRVQRAGSLAMLLETSHLYGRIKPSETIWYIDENQLVVSLKKHDRDLKWPDLVDSWGSLTMGLVQLLKGTSIHLVGNSTEINQKVAKELAHGLGYTPLSTSELLERYAQQSVDSWVNAEGADSVQEAEGAVLESLSSHVRAVVATLGGQFGVASKADKWRHLYAGFTIWLSQSEATDEASAREEARHNIEDRTIGYSNADVVVKLGGWEPDAARTVAQACLSALKQLILSDKKLTGKKSLYIRLGCRGDWPNIKPPGWDPSTVESYTSDV